LRITAQQGFQDFSASLRVHTFHNHYPIKALATDSSGRWLASGDSSGLVILWDLEQKIEKYRFQASKPGLNDEICKLEFRPNHNH
jgi:WD40 repeat protein